MVGHNVWKEFLEVPGRLSVELLLKMLKDRGHKEFHIISVNPPRDPKEYERVFFVLLFWSGFELLSFFILLTTISVTFHESVGWDIWMKMGSVGTHKSPLYIDTDIMLFPFILRHKLQYKCVIFAYSKVVFLHTGGPKQWWICINVVSLESWDSCGFNEPNCILVWWWLPRCQKHNKCSKRKLGPRKVG